MSEMQQRSVRPAHHDHDISRDTSLADHTDRRLWLAERCPTCGAHAGARCQRPFTMRRTPPAALTLHGARGWRQRPCPICRAQPGEGCVTPRGRAASGPHTARLCPARGQLHAREDVWRALERAGAKLALVRFRGGGGRPATIESVSITGAAGAPASSLWAGPDQWPSSPSKHCRQAASRARLSHTHPTPRDPHDPRHVLERAR